MNRADTKDVSTIQETPSFPTAPERFSYHSRRTLAGYAAVSLRGFVMGSVDLVPGVSAGTVAFIFGIYRELIDSIKGFGRPQFWKQLIHLRFRDAACTVNAPFLGALGIGIAAAIFSFARIIELALERQPVYTWSLFLGLIVASIYVILRRVRSWNAFTLTAVVVGAAFAFWLTRLSAFESPEAAWFLVISGTVAACAMILPGISGSFVLVLLGQYETLLDAVNERDILTLLTFIAGAAIGLALFSQILGLLLRRHYAPTTALLAGFMLGSAHILWPWRIAESGVYPLPSLGFETVVAFGITVAGIVTVLVVDVIFNMKEAKKLHSPS